MGYFDIERYLISQFNGKFLLWFRRQKWSEVSSLPWLSSWWCWLLTVVCAGCSQAGGWGQTGRPYCSPSLRSPPSAIITVSLSLLTIISSPLCFPYLREPSCYKVMKCTFYLSKSLVTSLAVLHSVIRRHCSVHCECAVSPVPLWSPHTPPVSQNIKIYKFSRVKIQFVVDYSDQFGWSIGLIYHKKSSPGV